MKCCSKDSVGEVEDVSCYTFVLMLILVQDFLNRKTLLSGFLFCNEVSTLLVTSMGGYPAIKVFSNHVFLLYVFRDNTFTDGAFYHPFGCL